MQFFSKQKVDALGVTAVTLQKILLFLMILSLFTIFNGGLFSFLLCLIGFIGAYKRRTGLLATYVTISVVLIVLCFFVALSSMFMATSDDYVYDYSSSSSSSNNEIVYSSQSQGSMYKLQRLFGRKLSSVVAAGSQSASSSSSSTESSESSESSNSWSYSSISSESSYSYEDDEVTGLIFLSIVVLVIGFFLAYLKVYSLVLAWRLRKLILTAAALPITDTQVHEFPQANTSCAIDAPAAPAPAPAAPFSPYFAPGFAPYPYMPMPMPQQGQAPHHVMFGQQPVFYTYAPMPQAEEKL